ncbi:MAG: hypothetical protein G01um1014107_77 [Parcubacteria group bacterium Gr01-1014_107]|nr:MAG: hypothetical protein G01um1014107_77 [Parcubacteria group bacterium Gr01-1014_107]
MIITTHAVVAAASAQILSQGPFGAFLVGFLSHFALDSLPHWDYPLETLTRGLSFRSIIKDFLKLSLDFLTGVSLVLFFFQWQEPLNLILWLAVLGSITPDIFHNIASFWRTKILKAFSELHNRFHCPEDLKNPWLGIIIQFFIVAAFIYFDL